MIPALSRERRGGFSLIEVLVVIGLLGMLIGLLLSAVQAARAAASRAACANNLRQIGLACHSYHEDYGTLPPRGPYNKRDLRMQRNLLPWMVVLLPYIEQQALYDTATSAYGLARQPYQNPPHVGLTSVVKPYACSADGRLSVSISDDRGHTAAYGSYLAVIGGALRQSGGLPARERGSMPMRGGVRFGEITDGMSQTLLIGERPPPGKYLAGSWYTYSAPVKYYDSPFYYGDGMLVFFGVAKAHCRAPFQFGPGRFDNPCDSYHFWSLHPGGGNFVLADGSVRFVQYAARDILPAMATRAGGEVVAFD